MIDIIAHLPKQSKHDQDPYECQIPTTQEDVRSLYNTGKTSLYGNLPHPKFIIISEHAYVSFIEILCDALAHNLRVATCHDGMEKEPLEIKFMR